MGRRAIGISLELWQQWSTLGYKSEYIECIEGLPEDAKFVRAFFGHRYNLILIFEHPDWSEDVLQTDQNIPMIPVTHQTRYKHDRLFSYKDRGIVRRVSIKGGVITTDWNSKGLVRGSLHSSHLDYGVEELT